MPPPLSLSLSLSDMEENKSKKLWIWVIGGIFLISGIGIITYLVWPKKSTETKIEQNSNTQKYQNQLTKQKEIFKNWEKELQGTEMALNDKEFIKKENISPNELAKSKKDLADFQKRAKTIKDKINSIENQLNNFNEENIKQLEQEIKWVNKQLDISDEPPGQEAPVSGSSAENSHAPNSDLENEQKQEAPVAPNYKLKSSTHGEQEAKSWEEARSITTSWVYFPLGCLGGSKKCGRCRIGCLPRKKAQIYLERIERVNSVDELQKIIQEAEKEIKDFKESLEGKVHFESAAVGCRVDATIKGKDKLIEAINKKFTNERWDNLKTLEEVSTLEKEIMDFINDWKEETK